MHSDVSGCVCITTFTPPTPNPHTAAVLMWNMNMTDGSACRLDICSKQIGLQWLINGLCSTVIRHTEPLLGSGHFSIITAANKTHKRALSLKASWRTQRAATGGHHEKYQTIQVAAGRRPHKDPAACTPHPHPNPPPICSHFIETVGRLRGTHSPFWQDFDPQPAGERVAAKVAAPHPSSSLSHSLFLSHTHSHTCYIIFFFFSFNTAPVCCFSHSNTFELQHTYPQYNHSIKY